MQIGFTISDVQDFHLYGILLENLIKSSNKITLFVDQEVSKITSPKNNKKIISKFNCEKIPYFSMKECLNLCGKCDVVISNEGQPFQGKINLPFDLVGLSWTMEYYVHGPRFLHLCSRFYVDCSKEQLKNTYKFENENKIIYEKHPKYYILKDISKSDICKMLGLKTEKFVTFLGPAPAQNYKEKLKDMFRIGKLFKSLGYTIIVKQKPKCPNLTNICDYDIVMLHNQYKYSTSLLLTYISDFVVGFNTSGVVESVRTNTPFINLYLDHKTVNYRKHPVSKIVYNNLLRIEKFEENIVSEFIHKHRLPNKRNDFEMDSFFAEMLK